MNKERSEGYRNFYILMCGLPMSIQEDMYQSLDTAESILFEGKPAYQINLELKEPMISKYWSVIISSDDYRLLGQKFNHPDQEEEGEYIRFEDQIEINSIQIPRMRHWYDKKSDAYLGSDIIVLEMK